MKNQKLTLVDFQQNQLSKVASRKISGGRSIVNVYIDINGNCFNILGEPIQNPGHGNGICGDIEYVFVTI